MLLKTILPSKDISIKSYDGQTEWMYFLKLMTYKKSIMLFGIKAVLISKINLIASLYTCV